MSGKAIISGAGRMLEGAVKNWKGTLALGSVGIASATGIGVFDQWKNILFTQGEGDGVTDGVKTTLFGKKNKDKSFAGNVVDELVDDGTYEGMKNTLKKGVNAIGETADHLRDAASNMTRPSEGFGTSYYPEGAPYVAAPYSASPYAASSYGEGSGGGLFGSFTNLLHTITGGNTNMMSMAALIPAAMLMFGNFGWMGKIASLFLGNFALKNINKPSARQQALPSSSASAPLQSENRDNSAVLREAYERESRRREEAKDNASTLVMRHRS